ncbi:FAD-dependent oxidoreductase [Methylobrevis albus]|uniref:FAD-dependent oxidoreductase n=1 Tax=Methylobrevis albus TaxID=2793297 RepID=A0A931I0X0_9HYPH|nr:FAD-dependent oxidoreductase [Methylobrevis albus]MBH0237329.1 FAD-dependent oxidoreductase [Methylobrevis albus]
MSQRITVDPKSLAGKFAAPEEHADVVVIGAGPAGLAAALEAAAAGLSVKLVDENPVSGGLIGLDVPQFFGGRADGSVQAKERMVERVLALNPGLEAAFEAGVDVALGTYCWGAFVPGPALESLPGPVVGLADEERAWLCGFDRLILATGARDLVLGFDGVDQPGVMGAQGLHALLRRYDAFDGRQLVILGSGDLAIDAAEAALARGLAVAALVEVADAPRGDPARLAALAAAGVDILTSHVILSAVRGSFGVSGAVVAPLADPAMPRTIPCDTICLALGRVPVVDLVDVAGARLVLDGARGGFAPATADGSATSLAEVFVAGDCAGAGAVLAGEADAAVSGRAAARAAIVSLGRNPAASDVAPAPTLPQGADELAYRRRWMEALVATGGMAPPVCLCEEVSRGELVGVAPPRYLGAGDPGRDLAAFAAKGPPSHDQMKRLTRVTMGACQGRRCREQVALTMAVAAGCELGAIPLAGYRAPVRPLPLGVLATLAETDAMAAEWDVWFGIPSQWVPYDAIGTPREQELIEFTMHM